MCIFSFKFLEISILIEIISDEINENIQLNDSLKINEEVVPQSPTTEILDSFSSNKSDFYAWVKFDLKDNESLLKKLLRNKFDNDYYKKKEDKMKQNELIGRFTADLIIKVANKTNLNKKLLTLIPSETKQFSTNENSTDEIVIDNYQMSSTEEKISSPLVTSTSSVIISENPISTSKIINEEIITQKTQENENVTTTQVTTIVSSGIFTFSLFFFY